MESRAKLFGHPIHQMLVVFPLGLLATAVVFDVIALARSQGYWSELAFWMIAAGVITGLLAAPFGFVDWLAIPSGTRAKRIGAFHGGGNLIVVLLFAVSFLMRTTRAAYLPDIQPFIVALLGAALALVTAWLGGELVFRLRVAVDDDAGLDASNSLAREGAVEVRT